MDWSTAVSEQNTEAGKEVVNMISRTLLIFPHYLRLQKWGENPIQSDPAFPQPDIYGLDHSITSVSTGIWYSYTQYLVQPSPLPKIRTQVYGSAPSLCDNCWTETSHVLDQGTRKNPYVTGWFLPQFSNWPDANNSASPRSED